jgi:HK97 gp10 family phage protein
VATTLKVTLRRDKLDRLMATIGSSATAQVADNAAYMRDYASQIAPKDTGAFSQSIYVSGPGEDSDYAQRANAARSLNPAATIIEEIKPASFDTAVQRFRGANGQFSTPEAVVGSAVEYSVFLEDGTRYMAPRPTFRPAVEATRERFVAGMKTVADV